MTIEQKGINPEGQEELKEKNSKAIVLIFRENQRYAEIVPGVVELLAAKGIKLDVHTFPPTTEEDEVKRLASTIAEKLPPEDSLIFTDETSRTSPDQHSLDTILKKSIWHDRADLKKEYTAEDGTRFAANRIEGIYRKLVELGHQYSHICIATSFLSDHTRTLFDKSEGWEEKIKSDKYFAQVLKDTFEKLGLAVIIEPHVEDDTFTEEEKTASMERIKQYLTDLTGDTLVIADHHLLSSMYGEETPNKLSLITTLDSSGRYVLSPERDENMREIAPPKDAEIKVFARLLEEEIINK